MKLELTDEQVRAVVLALRENNKFNADEKYDLDFASGHMGESELARAMENVEVKTDYRCHETGNLAVEFECRGRPSGIQTTRAKWWAFVLANGHYNGKRVILLETEELKNMILDCDTATGGDNHASKMKLLPLKKVLE